MLEQVLNYIHNYFEKEIHRGEFVISEGQLDVDFLQKGQYFRVVGSVLNDGIYRYPKADMTNETFKGEIWALAIPSAVVALANEIEEWTNANTNALSPFTSESFAGYSYSRASNEYGMPINWYDVFRTRLNYWRKIS